MYSLWGDLINYLFLLVIGVVFLIQYKRKEKKYLLWAGVVMIAMNLGLSANAYINLIEYQNKVERESNQRKKQTRDQLQKGIYEGTELKSDSLFNYNDKVKMIAPKGFKFSKLDIEIEGFMISKTYENGVFAVLVTIVSNKENDEFEDLVDKALQTYGNDEVSYDFETNPVLECKFSNCNIIDYEAATTKEITSQGFIMHILDKDNFYTFMFANNSVDPLITAELQIDLFESIAI